MEIRTNRVGVLVMLGEAEVAINRGADAGREAWATDGDHCGFIPEGEAAALIVLLMLLGA